MLCRLPESVAPKHLTPYLCLLLGLSSVSAQMVSELSNQVRLEPDWTCDTEQTVSCVVSSSQAEEWVNIIKEDPQDLATFQNSLDLQNKSDQNRNLSFELSYEPSSQSSFDPYGFKLSPEHVSHTLLDPDEVELSPEPTENDPFGFNITSSQIVQGSDPYGFKLSPEEENHEVLEYCGHDNQETMDLCNYHQVEPSNYSNKEVLETHNNENQEMLEHCSPNHRELLDLYHSGNHEVLESSSLDNRELVINENQELLVLSDGKLHRHLSHDSQEVVKPCSTISSEEVLEPCNCGNLEVLGPCSHGSWELLNFSCPENQEVLDFDSNQELLDFSHKENQDMLVSGSHDDQELVPLGGNENQELLGLGNHDNQEVRDLLNKKVFPEANNKCIVEPQLNFRSINSSSDSSDCDVTSEDLLVLEPNSSICTSSTTHISAADSIINMSANQDLATFNDPTRHNLLEGDLGSVFGAGGYIGCPDVADDLESLDRTQANSVQEPLQPVRPVRPPRPSLRVSCKILFDLLLFHAWSKFFLLLMNLDF